MAMPMVPTTPMTPLTRKNTVQTLQSPPSGRRGTFLMELRDQLQQQYDGDVEVERAKEVRAIHRILAKAPEARDAQDIDTLYEFVLQNGSTQQIFQGAQEIICKTICREMTLLELPAQGVVCYQGDYGDTFFIVVDGSVSLFIDSKKKLLVQREENGILQDRSNQYLQTPGLLGTKLLAAAAATRVDSEGNPVPENYGAFIKQIGAGGTFGELAVMDPTARRSCTITCDVPTSFICLKRGAYQRLIRITNSSQLDFTQVEYLETLFFFEQWPHGELTRLSNRLRHLNFAADTYLTRVGADANVVFFIYAGVVQESVPLVHHLNANGTVYKCARFETGASKRSLQEASLSTSSSGSGANGAIGGGGMSGASGSGGVGSSVAGASRLAKDGKQLPQTKRIALELNVYQDHDVCGEFPVLFNKHVYNTDLLAVTDVKTLIMDRETWKELFFMHGLEHIRDSYQKFRTLAESRENWRQTRTKLALANPGLVLTLSTKAMMHDGKCICGWCGSREHITGDAACAVMVASKKKQADKQKNGKNKARHALEVAIRAQAVKNTLSFVNTVVEAQQNERRQELGLNQQAVSATSGLAQAPRPPSSGSARRASFQVAAKWIISGESALSRTDNQDEGTSPAPALAVPPQTQDSGAADISARDGASPPSKSNHTPAQPTLNQAPKSPTGSSRNLPLAPSTTSSPLTPVALKAVVMTRKGAVSDVHKLSSVSRKLYANQMQQLANPNAAAVPALKLEDVRKSAFPEQVASCYRETLVRKMKRLSTLQDYFDARSNVLETMKTLETTGADERVRAFEQLQPRKPKIPKPMRQLCTKGRQPRPDRFNRKINRMLRRLRLKEHPLPVVEESLKDF